MVSVDYGASKVRSGHLICVLVSNEELSRIAREIAKDLGAINGETLRKKFPEICAGSAEDKAAAKLSEAAGGGAGGAGDAMPAKGTKALDQYTVDLTAKAKSGKIDPVLGRDF